MGRGSYIQRVGWNGWPGITGCARGTGCTGEGGENAKGGVFGKNEYVR